MLIIAKYRAVNRFVKAWWQNIMFPQRARTLGFHESRQIDVVLLRKIVKPRIFMTFPVTLAILPYRNKLVTGIIRSVKHGNNTDLARVLGFVVYEAFMKNKIFRGNTHGNIILVPVPISREHLLVRGYNQAELIARNVALADEYMNIRVDDKVIIKNRNTEAQEGLERAARLLGPRGALSIHPEFTIKPGTYILLDDVTTTGSTLKYCAETLLSAGIPKDKILALACSY